MGRVARSSTRIFLSFRNTAVKEEDLRYIENFSGIIVLDLQETHVGDLAMKYASTLISLQHLDLEGTEVTGKGLQHLSNPQLKSIDLDETNISDKDIHYLKKMSPSVAKIDLEGTNISNKSIPVLASLKYLRALKIVRTKITPKGFYQLQSLMPNCKVIYR